MKIQTALLYLLVSIPLWTQKHIVFSPINSIHGLSDNRVRTICQLSDSRMVIITEGLVNIFNGTSFHYMHYNEHKTYQLNNYNGYHRAYIDNNNYLWLKNQYKLLIFDLNRERDITNIDSVFTSSGITNRVDNLFMDSSFNLWFLTSKNELFLKQKNDKNASIFISDITQISPNKEDLLFDVEIRSNQLFLVFRSGEMVCYDFDTKKELYREPPLQANENRFASTIMVVPYKQYLYQARNGLGIGQLVRFNTLNRKWEPIMETNYWLNTLTIDPLGNCWISSFSGLWLIDENLRQKQIISPLHLVDGRKFESEICTQFNDNQGGLWVGTVNRGVLYYHPDRFKFRNFGNSMFNLPNMGSINILCLTEQNGNTLIGTDNGLFKYKKNETGIERLKAVPDNSVCEMLLKDSQQRIWVCTNNNGLFCITGNQTIHFKQPSHCIYMHESDNGQMHLCTNNGPGIFDPKTGRFELATSTTGEPIHRSYQLTTYQQDTLLGYCDQGLFFYHINSNIVSFPENNSKIRQHNNQHYHSIFTDSRGLIWLGTWDGLILYNPIKRSTISFHESDGLVNNSIRSIIEDAKGRIWASTSNGISCIELTPQPNDYLFRFTNYNNYDGVIENEFLPRSVTKTNDGRLLWGGLEGFNEIDLNNLNKPDAPLFVPLFTRFFLAGTEIKMGETYDGNIILKQSITTIKELRLKYDQNFCSFEFSALNYANPTQTIYRYQLEGVDATWRELKPADGIGRASYTNLPAGNYRIKVQAANNQQWKGSISELTIVITPPFWRTNWAYLTYLILLISLICVVISITIRHKIKKTQKQQKEELDQIKFTFFTNISHELRTPLSLIITPLDSLIKKTNNEPLKTQLAGISRNAHELLNIVNQLLDFRKLEMNNETLNLSYCNLGEWMEDMVSPFKDLARENEIHFEFNRPNSDLFLYADLDKLRKIINNLLSNAFKFTPPKGQIRLKVDKDDNTAQVIIQVSDTGCGISREEQALIFDRYYQVKNEKNQTGSGIGLHLVKEYALLHHGSVSVESRVNEGSTFTATLSSNLKLPKQNDELSKQVEKKKTLKILLVDDHKEFRIFLFNELSLKYHVIVADDGKEGLQKAREEQPDLIVSDVMMPIMTGTELCRQLKSDLNTSHIPVILLTAKTSEEAQIEGFEAGAEAYISKPFNMEILLLRIENLMEKQIKRKELFRQSIVITPSSLATSSMDKELINKALLHIETNMDNGSYSVEQLSKDMHMDRTGLYRKLTAITGQTPTEFIRAVRLKKAAQMLQNGHPVSEVAINVGFGSTSYFTKCFQEEYGVKPSQYK